MDKTGKKGDIWKSTKVGKIKKIFWGFGRKILQIWVKIEINSQSKHRIRETANATALFSFY